MSSQLADHSDIREREIFKLKRNSTTYEVEIFSDLSLEDYMEITKEVDWQTLRRFAEENQGKTVVYINPTMEGGGVAMLRPPLVHILKLLGVDAHWFVMEHRMRSGGNPFIFTKLMHNIAQRQAGDDVRITESGKQLHQEWCAENAEVLIKQPEIINADVIVIDDPQPAPLKRHIDKVNTNVKWVWRNHIDTSGGLMNDSSTPQGEVADYIFNECKIGEVDAMIAHPVAAFVHPKYADKTYFAPATIEPFDDLNRELSEDEIEIGIEFINNEIELKNQEFKRDNRLDDIQPLIDPTRRRMVLVARFDESKGMDKAMLMGVRARDMLAEEGMSDEDLPQLILIGNGSIDDPSGIPMFENILQIRRELYPDHKHDIVVMRLRHNYLAVNALMYPQLDKTGNNANQLVALQTSDAEGCETRITDWVRHGVPVVISNRGGMSLQITEGKSGFVLDYDQPYHDTERGAEIIAELMLDSARYEQIRLSTLQEAAKFNSREFTTVSNVIRMLRIFANVQRGVSADKCWLISEMASQSKERVTNSPLKVEATQE